MEAAMRRTACTLALILALGMAGGMVELQHANGQPDPYLQIDATYLVLDGSSVRNVIDADQPGVRIAVTRKSVEEIVLSRSIKRAELRGVDTISAGVDLVRAGNADVLAAPRPALLPISARLPAALGLPDRFHAAFGATAASQGLTRSLASPT